MRTPSIHAGDPCSTAPRPSGERAPSDRTGTTWAPKYAGGHRQEDDGEKEGRPVSIRPRRCGGIDRMASTEWRRALADTPGEIGWCRFRPCHERIGSDPRSVAARSKTASRQLTGRKFNSGIEQHSHFGPRKFEHATNYFGSTCHSRGGRASGKERSSC